MVDEPETPTEPTGEDRMTARERRAQRAKEAQRRDMPKRTMKRAAIAIAILLALVGVVAGVRFLSGLGPGPCPLEQTHEHSSFYIYVPDEANASSPKRVSLAHPTHDLRVPGGQGKFPPKAHMHYPNDWQGHHEFGCATVSEFLGYIGMEVEPGHLKLDPQLNGGKVYDDAGNLTVKFYLFLPDYDDRSGRTGNWSEKPDLPDHQPRDLERWLIAYGNWTDEQVQTMQNEIPRPTDSIPPELR